MVVERALADAPFSVVGQQHAAFHLPLGILDVGLGEGEVGIVDVVGASHHVLVVVHNVFQGGKPESVVFVASAEYHVFGHREVGLGATLAIGLVFGDEVFQLLAALQHVAQIVVGFVHHGIHALHSTVQLVVLQIASCLCGGGQAKGHCRQ